MIYDVILSKQNNQFLARVKEWPEIMVYNQKREKAIRQVQTQLFEYLTQQEVEVVQIEVPLPIKTNNPWLDKFGWFKDDPTFDDLQTEIAAYRREIDQEMALG
jgi:hypothetical protein